MARIVHTTPAGPEGRVTHLLDEPVGHPQAGVLLRLVQPDHVHEILVHGQRELQDVDATARVELEDGTVVHDPASPAG